MFNTIDRIDSAEGNVAKFVFKRDDAVAEAVLYRYPNYTERTVICCSTMSGCPVGCRFCGAGDFFARRLTGAEILYQVDRSIDATGVHHTNIHRLQIMFMSMGEPLLNQSGLTEAIETLAEKYPTAALLISTIGPKIDYGWLRDLSVKYPQVGLQFSIHKSNDADRNDLIPFRAKLSLEEIADEGLRWYEATGRKPFFNYCAGPDNSSLEDAYLLSHTFSPAVWNATVSVICERNEGLPTRNDYQRGLANDFSAMLLDRGFDVRVFDPAGQDDIGGGCGQLWFVQQWAEDNPDKVRRTAGTGLPKVHVPNERQDAYND